MLDLRLENLIKQYKIFKKNLKLKFEKSASPELKGNYLTSYYIWKWERVQGTLQVNNKISWDIKRPFVYNCILL